jgi:hypothetical protein
MSELNVFQKLNDARVQFHRLQLKKTGLNKFAGYQYFELGDFLIPALDVFHDNGLCAFISFGKDIATMTIVSVADGSKIELTSPMAEAQLKGCHPIQNLGAVETYTRRYLWVTALEIVEHDALDSSKPLTAAPVIPSRPMTEDLGLTDEVLQYINELSQEVTELAKTDGKAALNLVKAAGLDSDQKIALYNVLDSKTRSALTKAKE